jgi:hypothetical protein
MYTASHIYAKIFICGCDSKNIAKSSKTKWAYLKLLFQPDLTKNKEMGAKKQKPYFSNTPTDKKTIHYQIRMSKTFV